MNHYMYSLVLSCPMESGLCCLAELIRGFKYPLNNFCPECLLSLKKGGHEIQGVNCILERDPIKGN